MKNQAFTLIEILVVVLIIGILAAIAVPQYQIAVDKSDFRKYQSMAHSLEAAYYDYYMTNGKGTRNFSDLSFTMPSDFTTSFTSSIYNCVSNSEMFCCMSDSAPGYTAELNCGKKDLSVIYSRDLFGFGYQINNTPGGNCLAQIDNTRANRLCSSLGKQNYSSNSWTPQGLNNSYRYYTLY